MDARDQLRKCHAELMYMAATRDEVISRKHLAMFTNPTRSADCIVNFMLPLIDSKKQDSRIVEPFQKVDWTDVSM